MKSTDKVVIQFENFRISRSADKRNWILEEFRKGGLRPKTREQAEDKWFEVGYYGKLEHLVPALLNRSIEVPHCKSLDEQLKALLEEIKKAESRLLEQLKVIE